MRTLLFGTTYADTLEKRALQRMWFEMAERNAASCDAMIIDSQSPMLPPVPSSVWYHGFEDNIGHLSKTGKDGWGRAFCCGLQYAVDRGYEYAVHVECDSLLRPPIGPLIEDMEVSGDCVRTIRVSSMPSWPETGLMLFSVDWLRASHFIEGYDWAARPRRPEPEAHVGDLIGRDVSFMPLRGMRDDFHELTVDNVLERELDWLTHAALPVMEKFAA